ncbi:hypothetical protein AAFF39_08175 [Lactococcus garvieae]
MAIPHGKSSTVKEASFAVVRLQKVWIQVSMLHWIPRVR